MFVPGFQNTFNCFPMCDTRKCTFTKCGLYCGVWERLYQVQYQQTKNIRILEVDIDRAICRII